MPPISTSTQVKPIPMPAPSRIEGITGFFRLNDSARPSTAQLVTISAMNRPSTLYSSCIQAFIAISIRVTTPAIRPIITGLRTSGEMVWRSAEMIALVRISTRVVAKPMPRPLVAVVVTASAGHRASICTRATL
ncbi:hypothetical protein D3C84_1018200 [compost metagenome]